MIRPVYSDECPKEVVANFVANRVPNCSRGFDNYTAIGVVSDNKLIAGCVYTNWEPESGVIEMSAAADTPKWINKATLHAIFSYPFDMLECQCVVLRVSEFNDRMRKIALKLGMVEHIIPRLRGRNEADVLYVLYDDVWRKKYGRLN